MAHPTRFERVTFAFGGVIKAVAIGFNASSLPVYGRTYAAYSSNLFQHAPLSYVLSAPMAPQRTTSAEEDSGGRENYY